MSDSDRTLAPPSEHLLRVPALPADMGYGEEHAILRGSARRLLAEKSDLGVLRRRLSEESGHDPALYREIAELGWLAVGSPDGGGLSPMHLGVLCEEMGRVLFPSPFLPTVLCLSALEVGGSAAQFAAHSPALVAGQTIGTVASDEPRGNLDGEPSSTRAEHSGDVVRLTGEKVHVLYGAQASLVIVPAREAGGGFGLYALPLPCPGVRVESQTSVDASRPTARLQLHGVELKASCRLDGDAGGALSAMQSLGATLTAAEMLGAADAVLEMTRAYACQREQFGKAIGSFQAVKHPLVDVMLGVELGRSLLYGAATLLSSGSLDEASVAARMAKAHASDVLANAVKRGVQLHGGFGFTWDADVHFFFKRLLSSRAAFGDAAHHRKKLAARLLGPLPDDA
ncbi:MAG: acyl-CoA dehydrogenase [Myxococcales bacterium]|nr:acyl-CoA dehydrogenase [Myxococcales bacterium]